jgi:pimeloyl-ACP methyl ester carboxylesterase
MFATMPATAADEAANWALSIQISCPTLVVRGANSPVLSAAVAQRMAAEIPACRWVEIPNAGHNVPGENLPDFLAAVSPFLLAAEA